VSEVESKQADVTPRQNVYVVDDDSMVRRSLFFSLGAAGFEVRSFASGDDLLAEVDVLEPGCILLDLRMPEKNGSEVLHELGERVRRFPVVIITGHGEIDVAVRTMKMGASDFLEKPFSEAALLEVLEPIFRTLPEHAQADAERAKASARVAKLTGRERDVLQGLVSGLSNKAAALELGISARTVEIHRGNLMKRLETKSVGEAVRIALQAGMKPK
jgi:two-component system, LuxR family, response regulator FixJ